MRRLVIRDGTENGKSLEFDLAELLAALGARVSSSQWKCNELWYVSHQDLEIPVLEMLNRGETVTGRELLQALPMLRQVINGEFHASEAGRTWVILKAVDSTWWEVISDDPGVLAAIRTHFRNVDEPGASA